MHEVFRINIVDATYPQDRPTIHFTKDVDLYDCVVAAGEQLEDIELPSQFENEDVWTYLEADAASMPDIEFPYVLLDEVTIWTNF